MIPKWRDMRTKSEYNIGDIVHSNTKGVKMNKINTWFNKIDRMFLLSPSFYTILSGALIGAAINLLTGLIFAKEMLSINVILPILFLLASSGLFVYISLILEHLRPKAKDVDYLLNMIQDHRKKLWISAFVGFACVIISMICLIFAMGY